MGCCEWRCAMVMFHAKPAGRQERKDLIRKGRKE